VTIPLRDLRVDAARLSVDERRALTDRLWEELGALWVAEAGDAVTAGFPDERLARLAATTTGGRLTGVDEADTSYLDTWRAYARPARAGRLLVRPAWVTAPAAGEPARGRPPRVDDVEISIDPGHAFGHGGHPSTRLVLEVLSERLQGGERVLDVGCGSGVLSVAAIRLGAASALALDIDPVARQVTEVNAEANGLAGRVTVSGQPARSVKGVFDVVLANIGVVVLRELAEPLARLVAPGGPSTPGGSSTPGGNLAAGGWLTLSGLLEHQWPQVAERARGLRVDDVRSEDGWSAVTLVSPSR
jgi:ribosomal protein L11 methyltransferase